MTQQESCDILSLLRKLICFLSAHCNADRSSPEPVEPPAAVRFSSGEKKKARRSREGRTRKREKQIEIETISSRHAVCLLDFFVCREKRKKTSQCKHRLVPGGGRWIRPSADGPFRGSDAPPAHHSLPLPFESTRQKEKTVTPDGATVFLVGEGGFEPPKSLTTDLQSAPFGHSGIPPYLLVRGAGRRIRTPDLLITNQLLYQLSYTSISATNKTYVSRL